MLEEVRTYFVGKEEDIKSKTVLQRFALGTGQSRGTCL